MWALIRRKTTPQLKLAAALAVVAVCTNRLVPAQPSALPDLVAEIKSVSQYATIPPYSPTLYPPYRCVVEYQVRNIGNAPSRAQDAWFAEFSIDGQKVKAGNSEYIIWPHDQSQRELSPGKSYGLAARIFVAPSTSCLLSSAFAVTVDPQGKETEADETNNSARYNCRVPQTIPAELGYTREEIRRCAVSPLAATIITRDGRQQSLQAAVDPRGVVMEGDIRLHPNQLVGSGVARGTGRTSIAARWPGARVPYTIDGSIVDDPANPDDVWDRVQFAISHWTANTPVRLLAVTPTKGNPCGVNDQDCVTFKMGSGCDSSVGRVGGQQFINLTTGCPRGSVVHEIGHAVGLFHEQSAENRNKFVRINKQNISDGQEHNFDAFTTQWSDGIDYTSYDYGSIMHYGATAFSKNGLPTIDRLDGGPAAAMGQRVGLSPRDQAAVEAIYGPFAFSYRGPLPDRECVAVNEPNDGDSWNDNFFCATKKGASWSHSGPLPGRVCTKITESTDVHSWNNNFLCVDHLWREKFTWSSSGPVAGQRCIAFNEPSDPDGWNDNFLCWVDSPLVAPFKTVVVRLTDIDDDAYVWVGDAPGSNSQAICSARISGSLAGSADCDLTAVVRSMGLNFDQRFTIKFGNGGGFNSHGNVEILADGRSVWSKTKSAATRHTGWFYRVVTLVDFTRGTIRIVDENECHNIGDCPN